MSDLPVPLFDASFWCLKLLKLRSSPSRRCCCYLVEFWINRFSLPDNVLQGYRTMGSNGRRVHFDSLPELRGMEVQLLLKSPKVRVKKPWLGLVNGCLRELYYLQWVLSAYYVYSSKSFAMVLVALLLTSLAVIPTATVKANTKTITVPNDYPPQIFIRPFCSDAKL